MKRLVVALLAGCLAASPSVTFAAEGGACVYDAIPPEVRSRTAQTAARARDRLPPALTNAVAQCAGRHGWTEDQAMAAGQIAVWRLTSLASYQAAVRRGATPAQLADLQQRLVAVNFRVTIAGIEDDRADGEPLFAAMRAAGLDLGNRYAGNVMVWLAAQSAAEDEELAFVRL